MPIKTLGANRGQNQVIRPVFEKSSMKKANAHPSCPTGRHDDPGFVVLRHGVRPEITLEVDNVYPGTIFGLPDQNTRSLDSLEESLTQREYRGLLAPTSRN